jgi:3-dehydroquinate dehydratase-2
MTLRVLVLQGPNLNLLGTREPEIYGLQTLGEIHAKIARSARRLGIEVTFFQSNHEGALIDRLHERDFDVAIVNAAGLTHTSVSLRDALLAVQRPFIEVHLSDPSTREPFRRVNFLADVALESIVGLGPDGYLVALESIARRYRTAGATHGDAGGAGVAGGRAVAGRPEAAGSADERRASSGSDEANGDA